MAIVIDTSIDCRFNCPVCGNGDGYLNIAKCHWGICHHCGVRWTIGCNLFSSWRDETEDQWDENAEILADLEDIDDAISVAHRESQARASNRDNIERPGN